MKQLIALIYISGLLFSCTPADKKTSLDQKVLTSLGTKYKIEFGELSSMYQSEIEADSSNVQAYVGIAESQILLYVFGYIPKTECMPIAISAYQKANQLDSLNSNVRKLAGIINFLDWNWNESKLEFESAITIDPTNLNARHWYSLWLISMKRIDDAMAQSDTIQTMDENNDYRIGRASLFYFQHRYEEMKTLMDKEIEEDPSIPWAYDWLGMAYNGLGEHEEALDTYYKAFNLSDGTVEVGAGLGHALGNAGEKDEAKRMADYYEEASTNNYLPYCQRAFIHIGLEENEKALDLLEQAYENESWFLIFIQAEHWYDPLRKEQRFQDIMSKMKFPKEGVN